MGVCSALWLGKLTYDVGQLSQSLTAQQTQITQNEQTNDNLNDQLIALQRQLQTHLQVKTEAKIAKVVEENSTNSHLDPMLLVRQKLELIQFALKQHQDLYAIEKIQELNHQLLHDNLAPALNQNLYEALAKDQQTIEQYYHQQQSQLTQIHVISKQADDEFKNLLNQNSQNYQPVKTSSHFWQKWLDIQPTQRAQSELMVQRLVVKEVQLRFLLAQQYLENGDINSYQQAIDDTLTTLQSAPSLQQKTLQSLLKKTKQIPFLPVPKMSAFDLLNR